jgi:lysophospholipase L1-like esterase
MARQGAGTMLALALLAPASGLAQALPTPPPVPAPVPDAVSAMMSDPCIAARTDWPDLCHYRNQNRGVQTNPRAVFIGDSITEFWLTIAPALFAGDIVDRGVSGQTSQQMVGRFYQDVVRLHPRVVQILCGTNDIAGNGGPTSPDDYANAVLAMTDMARANGIAVVLGAIPPAGAFNWRPGYRPASEIIALNSWLRALAMQRGLVFADYHTALADAGGAMKPGLSSDGVHPNAAGYAVMEPIARAAVAQAETLRASASAGPNPQPAKDVTLSQRR